MQAHGSIVVARPAEAAFAFVADPANDSHWRSNLVRSSGTVAGVGDTVSQTYSYQGRTQHVTADVTEFERPSRFTLVVHEPLRIRLSFQFTPEGDGTRVGATISSTLTGAAALFEGRVQSEAERLIKADLQRLKTALEGAEEPR